MAVGEYVHDHTPGSQLVILNATGHCPHLSAPEETIAAMRAFLEAPMSERGPEEARRG